jgi:hypothetical protein
MRGDWLTTWSELEGKTIAKVKEVPANRDEESVWLTFTDGTRARLRGWDDGSVFVEPPRERSKR